MMEIESNYFRESSSYQNSIDRFSRISSSSIISEIDSKISAVDLDEFNSNSLVIVNGQLIKKNKKEFRCHWFGCQKSYTKPIRLEEHIRSHTNERPFECNKCPATYRRETHLTAHMRMHLPESSRPLLCGFKDLNHSSSSDQIVQTCQRRFWTQQHLKVHRENVHEGKQGQSKLKCQICQMEFIKHRSLRNHFIQLHCPQDVPKPYICPFQNCHLSFSHPSRLRKHERTHDPFRYTCIHEDCLNDEKVSIQQRSFSSWTDLQRHTRDVHRFSCPTLNCNRNKKPFKSIRSLKHHIQSYHSSDNSNQIDPSIMLSTSKFTSTSRNEGSFLCKEFPPCQRAYKSARALQRHINLNHLTDHHTPCPFQGCAFSSASPLGLKKHIKSKHSDQTQTRSELASQTINSQPHPDTNFTHAKPQKLTRFEKLTQIDLLTGIGYSNWPINNQDQPMTASTSHSVRKFACPFFDLSIALTAPQSQNQSSSSPDSAQNVDQNETIHSTLQDKCLLRFNRLYDIQRHLQSFHSLTVDRQTLKNFYGVI